MTDYWPDEEGSIVDGFICGFCYADGAFNAGEVVTWGTSAVGRVAVITAGAIGIGVGVALRAASGAGSIVPVAFSGIVKMTVGETLAIGDLVFDLTSVALAGISASNTLCINSATRKILGCAMQEALAPADEFLVLLGGDGISAGLV